MQTSGSRHASSSSNELTAGVAAFGTGSAVTHRRQQHGQRRGRPHRKRVGQRRRRRPYLRRRHRPRPMRLLAAHRRARRGRITDVARVSSIGAPVFSMPGEPRSSEPGSNPTGENEPFRTIAADTANRRGLITPPHLLYRPRLHVNPGCTGSTPDRSDFFGSNMVTQRSKTCRPSSFSNGVAGIQLGSEIMAAAARAPATFSPAFPVKNAKVRRRTSEFKPRAMKNSPPTRRRYGSVQALCFGWCV